MPDERLLWTRYPQVGFRLGDNRIRSGTADAGVVKAATAGALSFFGPVVGPAGVVLDGIEEIKQLYQLSGT